MPVFDKDFGWAALMAKSGQLNQEKTVKVGILGNAGKGPNGVNIVNYAAYNEFGTSKIPARSFLRKTHDASGGKWLEYFSKDIGESIDGKLTVDQAFNRAGARMQAAVRRRITTIQTPANAPSTIKAKGSSNPLIDSGAMRKAINWEFE